MAKTKIFISSVQQEFALERQLLHDYILADPLLGRFFEPFLFGNLKQPIFEQNDDFKTTLFRPNIEILHPHHPLSTPQAPPKFPLSSIELKNLLKALDGEMSRSETQEILGLRDPKNFRENYIKPALKEDVIQMGHPENPNHPEQKYCLTAKGQLVLKNIIEGRNEYLNEGVNEGVKINIEGANENVLAELQHLYSIISSAEGKKAIELNELIHKSLATTERYLKILRENNLIEFVGAPKTGGYYIKK